MQALLDYARTYRKAVLAALALLLIQFVDSETVDWVVAVVGTLLVGATPNDQAAAARVRNR